MKEFKKSVYIDSSERIVGNTFLVSLTEFVKGFPCVNLKSYKELYCKLMKLVSNKALHHKNCNWDFITEQATLLTEYYLAVAKVPK